MKDTSTVFEIIKKIPIFEALKEYQKKKISKFFIKEYFSMGDHILVGKDKTEFGRILISGNVRQIVEHPINKNIMTLNIEKHISYLGLTYDEQVNPFELVSAATDCVFLKIKIKDWEILLKEFPEICLILNECIRPSNLWPLINNRKDILIPEKAKDLKKWINLILDKSEAITFYDEKDFIKFNQAYRLFETGGSPFFASAIGDIGNNLTDEELIQAFPMHEKDIKSGKYRDRLKETVQEINDMQERFTLHNDKFKNKYDPNKFKPGTVAHTRETARWAAVEHSRYLYLFAEESFKRALERTNKIYEGLATEPVFQDNSKIAANDIQVLAEDKSIQDEMVLLAQEVEMLKETEGDNRKEIAFKKKKMKALDNYYAVLTAKENQTKDGKRFSRTPANIKKLRKVFLEYIDILAEEKGTYTNVNNIDASLRNLIDLGVLKDRSRVYERAVRFLADPSELDRLSDNMQNQFLFIFNNQIKYYKNSVKNKIAKQERAVLLRAFANLGVLPIPEEAEAFILTGDVSVLKTFQDKTGVITEESNPELYQAIQEKIENYRKLYNKNVEKPAEKKEDTQEQQPDPDFESARLDQQEDFDKASRDGQPLPAINTDIISEEEAIVLNRLYDKYAQGSKDEVLSEDEWLELSKTKRQYNAIKKLFDRYKADIKNIDDVNKTPTFNQWFTKNRGENSIKSILALGGASSLQPSDFLPKEQKIEPKQLPSNQKRIKAGFNKDINLVRIKTTDQEGNEVAIYELQDNQGSILSEGILQRAGVENTSYVSIREGENAFNNFKNFLNNPLILVVLVTSLWALWYHFCTGLRHLYWDMGYGYNLKSVSISGWVAVVCSFLLTFLTILFFIN